LQENKTRARKYKKKIRTEETLFAECQNAKSLFTSLLDSWVVSSEHRLHKCMSRELVETVKIMHEMNHNENNNEIYEKAHNIFSELTERRKSCHMNLIAELLSFILTCKLLNQTVDVIDEQALVEGENVSVWNSYVPISCLQDGMYGFFPSFFKQTVPLTSKHNSMEREPFVEFLSFGVFYTRLATKVTVTIEAGLVLSNEKYRLLRPLYLLATEHVVPCY